VLLLKDGRACVLTRLDRSEFAEIIFRETGFASKTVPLAEIAARYGGYCHIRAAQAARRPTCDEEVPAPTHSWFWVLCGDSSATTWKRWSPR